MNLAEGRVCVLLKLSDGHKDEVSAHHNHKGLQTLRSMVRVDISIRGESSNANVKVLKALLSLVRDKLLPQWPGLMVDIVEERCHFN